MIVDFLALLARLHPAPSLPPMSRDEKIRAARQSSRLAIEQARRQFVLPVRLRGAGVTVHSRFRSYPHG